jgi:hypothetical protein
VQDDVNEQNWKSGIRRSVESQRSFNGFNKKKKKNVDLTGIPRQLLRESYIDNEKLAFFFENIMKAVAAKYCPADLPVIYSDEAA